MVVPLAIGLGQEFLDSFTFMGNNRSLLLHDTLGTIALCAAALGVALVITLPIAVFLLDAFVFPRRMQRRWLAAKEHLLFVSHIAAVFARSGVLDETVTTLEEASV